MPRTCSNKGRCCRETWGTCSNIHYLGKYYLVKFHFLNLFNEKHCIRDICILNNFFIKFLDFIFETVKEKLFPFLERCLFHFFVHYITATVTWKVTFMTMIICLWFLQLLINPLINYLGCYSFDIFSSFLPHLFREFSDNYNATVVLNWRWMYSYLLQIWSNISVDRTL